MRSSVLHQLPLVPSLDHPHSRDLARISAALDQLPHEVMASVERDLCRDARSDCGRRGLAAEQVLRILVVKQLTGMSYGRLAFALDDSMSYRAFCRLGAGKTPRKSALQDNIKRLTTATLEQFHRAVVQLAGRSGVDDGKRVSIDSTAVESNIHHPTDSSLLYDCIRKLTSLLLDYGQLLSLRFSDHRKRAKRRAFEIGNAKSMKLRIPLYKDLLGIVDRCVGYANDAIAALRQHADLRHLANILEHFVELTVKVRAQTHRRVFEGRSVPASDKIVSVFEPHTDVIIKDNRNTLYGHKVFITIGSSGLVLDLHVPRGNPADASLASPLVSALENKFGALPVEAAFDGGFCSHANLKSIKELGVEAVAFTSPRGLTIEQMTETRERFCSLRRFRSSIEGTIGWLKNALGLRRCPLRGFSSFQAYCWAAVISLDLLIIARRR